MTAPDRPGLAYPAQDGAGLALPSHPGGPRQIAMHHQVMSHVDQRIAAVAHLSIGFGVIVGVGFLVGLAINLVIWLRSKRSPVVELHAEQAGAYQLSVFLINIGLVGLWILMAVGVIGGPNVTIGSVPLWQPLAGSWCVSTPLIAAWYFGTILYGVYGGLRVAFGRDFSYPIIGAWVERRMAKRER